MGKFFCNGTDDHHQPRVLLRTPIDWASGRSSCSCAGQPEMLRDTPTAQSDWLPPFGSRQPQAEEALLEAATPEGVFAAQRTLFAI